MKKYTLLAGLVTASLVFGTEGDCGLNDFFEKLGDRIYCEAETSGSTDKINEVLSAANKEFGKKLSDCAPSKEQTEAVLHHIAAGGTPEMLEELAKTNNFDGFDKVNKTTGMTPLMTAASSGNIDLVNAFLEKGANPARETALEVNGEENIMTAEGSALIIPSIYRDQRHLLLNVLPLLLSQSARYGKYPYDGEVKKLLRPVAPFIVCGQLIAVAKEKATK